MLDGKLSFNILTSTETRKVDLGKQPKPVRPVSKGTFFNPAP
jgi:hypothetical protein